MLNIKQLKKEKVLYYTNLSSKLLNILTGVLRSLKIINNKADLINTVFNDFFMLLATINRDHEVQIWLI